MMLCLQEKSPGTIIWHYNRSMIKVLGLTLLFMFGVFVCGEAYAKKYVYIGFVTSKRVSYKKFVKYITVKNTDKKSIFKKSKKLNPNIKNWNSIPSNTKIIVLIPGNKLRMGRYQKMFSSLKGGAEAREKDKKKKGTYGDDGFSLSSFYTISLGSFRNEYNGSSITNTQNSPLTLGLFSSYRPYKMPFFASGSIYISQLNPAEYGQGQEISVPLEYGINAYFNYRLNIMKMVPYIGFDYERFSTFNTEELPTGVPLATRELQMGYLTIGGFYGFSIFGLPAGSKISVSTVMMSKASRDSLVSNEDFTGFKYILYFTINVFEGFAAQCFFKQHLLSGPTKLTITRYGVGFGYRFF